MGVPLENLRSTRFLDMLRRTPFPVATLAMVLTLGAVSESCSRYLISAAQAQSAPAPVSAPATVPEGTRVRIDGSESMVAINQALKKQFETQFSGTQVDLGRGGSDAALQALREDRIDLAAIARPLTPEEQAEGFAQTPVTRRKIAIVVGKDNPFTGDLTDVQFAQVFRGEITDWSQLGGEPKPIRFIDRPETSDTRRALQNYSVLQPFTPGPTVESINSDDTNAMIRRLGDDGIGYAIVDQVADNDNVRILSVYGVLPDDPAYSFSQPLTYVYKAANPSPGALAFLGFAATPENQQLLATTEVKPSGWGGFLSLPSFFGGGQSESASPSPDAAAPEAEPAPDAAAPEAPAADTAPADPTVAQAPPADITTETGGRGVPGWLWLLSIPLLGALLWVLLNGLNRSSEEEPSPRRAVAPTALAAEQSGERSRIVLTPRSSHDAYAYWEVPEAHRMRIRREEGGHHLALRLYDVTGLEFDRHPAHSIQEFECDEFIQDKHVPVEPDRDYVAEIGYVTYQDRWVALARSAAVHTPAAESLQVDGSSTPVADVAPDTPPAVDPSLGATAAATAAGTGVTAAGVTAANQRQPRIKRSQIVLVPRNSQEAYAYWEVLEQHKVIAKQHGGQDFVLRICDVTGINLDHQAPHNVQEFRCNESDRDRHVAVPEAGEYIAEIGYIADNGRWLRIARSAPVQISTSGSESTSSTY